MHPSKERPEPQSKKITLDLRKNRVNMEMKISKIILNDFNEFKNKNELDNCILHQSRPVVNNIDVIWTTERRYSGRLIDLDKIYNDFNKFATLNPNDLCQIANMEFVDNIYAVKYSITRSYILNFVFHEEKADEN